MASMAARLASSILLLVPIDPDRSMTSVSETGMRALVSVCACSTPVSAMRTKTSPPPFAGSTVRSSDASTFTGASVGDVTGGFVPGSVGVVPLLT
jgi:hypothetical protein